MSALPTKEQNPDGLHQRYIVSRSDGTPIDPNAIYFVMRLDNGGKDHSHIYAGRKAAIEWALKITEDDKASHLWKTAAQLIALIEDLEMSEPLNYAPRIS